MTGGFVAYALRNRLKGLDGSPLVSMMEASHLRKFHHRAQFGRLNSPGRRRIFGQAKWVRLP
jgi:hypothetical protein